MAEVATPTIERPARWRRALSILQRGTGQPAPTHLGKGDCMPSNRVYEIDLLRFLAALSVVLFHYTFRGYAADGMSIMPYPLLAPYAKYGFLGVQLFFMISGFVILMTAQGGSLKKFVISRIVRLYPAFWACCTITFLVTLMLGAGRYAASLQTYLVNMTMTSQFVHQPDIDGVYWSLFVEMRFYVLIGLILLFRKMARIELILTLWLIVSSVEVFVPVPKLGFFLVPEFASYFIAGATFYMIYANGFTVRRLAVVLGALAMSLHHTLSLIAGLEQHYHVAFHAYVLASAIVAFYIVLLLVALRHTAFLSRKQWVAVGALTYPLYLVHQNVGFMLFNWLYPSVNANVLLWGTVGLMLFVAYAVNRHVERAYAKDIKNALELLFARIPARAMRPSGES